MGFIPRDYQQFADEALWRFVHNQPDKNPLVILPTGTGKSLNMAMFCWRMLAAYPRVKIMNLTHVKELIEGNYRTMIKLWPAAPAGVYSAGLGQKDVYAQITFGGVQSVAKRLGRFGKIDFLVVDEAHRIGGGDNATYMKVIKQLREANPKMIVIGFTATAFRMGSGMLTDGEIFDSIAFDGSDGEAFIWFIKNGYLISPVPKNPGFELDESQISITAGDYNSAEASQAMADQDILERAVDQMIQLGEAQGRQCWMTFNQSIDDADLVADMFRYKGYAFEAVHSRRSDRDEVLKALKRGELKGVSNKDILTTGFDHPPIDMIGMLRLTRSPGLWVQMLGRGTRPVYVNGYYGSQHNGGPPLDSDSTVWHDLETLEGRLASILASPKQSCLVLDYVGNTMRLGPINYPNVPKRRGTKAGKVPMRECPECQTYNHISKPACEECGYVFPVETKITENASHKELVSSRVLDLTKMPEAREIGIFGVNRMIASINEGRGDKLDTLRVDYFCGFQRFSAWICFLHPSGSFPRNRAEQWWRAHGGKGAAPADLDEVIKAFDQLSKPKFIKVWTNTRYPEILDFDHRGTRFELPPEAGGPPLQEPDPDPLEKSREEQRQQDQRRAQIMQEMYDDEIPF